MITQIFLRKLLHFLRGRRQRRRWNNDEMEQKRERMGSRTSLSTVATIKNVNANAIMRVLCGV